MNIFIKGTVYCSFLLSFFYVKNICTTIIIDETTFSDLDILKISEYIDNTRTSAGKDFLREYLINPIYEQEILTKRQGALLFFIKYPELSSLRTMMTDISHHEKAVHCMSAHDSSHQKIIQDMYFSWPALKKYNTFSYALDASFASHIAGLCLPLCEYLILHTSVALLLNMKPCDHHHSTMDDHDCSMHADSNIASFSSHLLQMAIAGCHVPSIFNMVKTINTSFSATHSLKEELLSVSEYLRLGKKMYHILKETDDAHTYLEAFLRLESFFGQYQRCSENCLSFIDALENFRKNQKSLLPDRIGTTLALYAHYTEIKDELIDLTKAIGEIDHYSSLAILMTEQTDEQPWCLVDYAHSDTPCIDIQGLRHLFLCGKIIKPWNMRYHDIQHMVITGDNGSGKSTYINGLGQAIILAQSLGIVPAKTAVLTPFYALCSYRLIQDNITQGTSRFYAECSRVEDILEKIEHAAPYFCCVLLDEPFTSTHTSKGMVYLQQAFARLFDAHNTISCTVTHYPTESSLIENNNKTGYLRFS